MQSSRELPVKTHGDTLGYIMCLSVRKLFVLFTNPCITDKETLMAAFQRQQ